MLGLWVMNSTAKYPDPVTFFIFNDCFSGFLSDELVNLRLLMNAPSLRSSPCWPSGSTGVFSFCFGFIMAELAHIKLLQRGVQTWNRWRRENPTDRLDLSEAILGSANLSGFDLQKVNLNKCYLRKANLCGANLHQSNLRGAYLRRANLRGAILSEANLTGTCLLGVNLSEANLDLADLSGANLRYATLSDVRHWETILSMQLTNICETENAPSGFRKWAKEQGADSSGVKVWTALKLKAGLL